VDVRSLPALLAALPAEAGVAVARDGDRTIVAARTAETIVADGADAFAALDRIEAGTDWWAGFCTYDLGRAVEPVVTRTADDRTIPDLAFARFDARAVIDVDGSTTIIGGGEGADLLRGAIWAAGRPRAARPRPPAARTWRSSLDRATHADAVRAIAGHLSAGDCYQVNLTRRVTHDRAVSPVGLFCALWEHNPAPHACLVSFGTRGPALAVVGASPELFLGVDGNELVTRPIKGTHRDPDALRQSSKDAAEHVMIVDLARNDLGRVCVPGSVRVPELMVVEPHPGLHHLVSTVVGTRRDGVALGAAVRALFPAASITGAPKPAVMQIVEDLEPVRRGVYCGATGWIDAAAGRAQLAVAIRTFTVTASHTDLGVGGGIVADSDAAAEWAETELKAHRLLEAAAGEATGTTRTREARS
jgi:para-aminobenzoate synthetase component 1